MKMMQLGNTEINICCNRDKTFSLYILVSDPDPGRFPKFCQSLPKKPYPKLSVAKNEVFG
jgi:hypothetical protein